MSQQSLREIDLSKYATKEVTNEVLELIRIFEILKKIILSVVIGVVFTVLIPYLLFPSFREQSFIEVWLPWSGVTGLIAGIIIAPAHFCSRLIKSLTGILQLLANTLKIVVVDMKSVESGELVLPSAGQLLQAGTRDIIFPIVEDAIEDVVPWFATPLIWIYKMGLGRMIKFGVARIPFEKFQDEHHNALAEAEFQRSAENIARHSEDISQGLTAFQNSLSKIGRGLIILVTIPSYILSLVTILVSCSIFIFIHELW